MCWMPSSLPRPSRLGQSAPPTVPPLHCRPVEESANTANSSFTPTKTLPVSVMTAAARAKSGVHPGVVGSASKTSPGRKRSNSAGPRMMRPDRGPATRYARARPRGSGHGKRGLADRYAGKCAGVAPVVPGGARARESPQWGGEFPRALAKERPHDPAVGWHRVGAREATPSRRVELCVGSAAPGTRPDPRRARPVDQPDHARPPPVRVPRPGPLSRPRVPARPTSA